MKKLILAESAGFCFGVQRAVSIAEKNAGSGRRVVTLGQLIHNNAVTDRLAVGSAKPLRCPAPGSSPE